MSDALDSLTDAALSEVFAVECAGWRDVGTIHWQRPDAEKLPHWLKFEPLPPFATSADAVLPFMERSEEYPEILRPWHGLTEDAVEAKRVWEVRFDSVWAIAPTLPRAICIALIRAKRAERGGAK